jgi:hypothetical protein
MQQNSTEDTKTARKVWLKHIFSAEYWQEQNHWLGFLTVLLIFSVSVYLMIHNLEKFKPEDAKHYYDDPHEAEFKTMDANDIAYLTSLINEGSTNIPVGNTLQAEEDSGSVGNKNQSNVLRFSLNPNSHAVKEYIVYQLPYVYPDDTIKIFSLLDEQPNSLAINFIQNAKFRVKSYFWLAGPHTYIEIIFWTIFGVITSILFYIAMAIAKGTGFKPSETPGHLAKIVYSPFISLIIIFSYNYLSNPDSFLDVSASKGTLIISFLLGFYSSRAMKLLDKLKDLILPYGDDSKSVAVPTMQTDPELITAQTTSAVEVDVTLNDPEHTDAEELNGHIAQTIVTLIPQAGGEPIILAKTGDDELDGKFTTQNVQQGAYNLTASLTTADGGNYGAQQGIQVINGENTFTITLTKTEISG